MVAACAMEEWAEDDLYDLSRGAYPYSELPREKFDQVVAVLSEGFASRWGRNSALLHRDGVNRRLKGRRSARLTALTSGGAIPDNADYDVIAEPEGVFVGTLNEDFAIESMAGDVFLLGNTPWKIRRVESGRVRVEDAQGLTPSIPFWLGEAPGRTWELSEEVGDLREGVDQRLDDQQEAGEWVTSETGVTGEAARQLVDYLAEGKRILGIVPTARRVVAERFFDESGGMQLVIHAPFGTRINRAWGLALRKEICRTFDFELQASATDDGLNFSLGPSLSFPLEEVFTYIKSGKVEHVLTQAVFQTPIFGTRWRWDVTRALAVLRHSGGRKVPPPLQRMRSDDLLAAVFPAQVECQDNAMPGDIEVPDHPLVFETVRDCLTDATNLDGLKEILNNIESGEIEIYARDTVQPSVFAHQILNAMPYAFLDDAPLEERRARAVSLRRALPEDSRDLAALDPKAIEDESNNAWPRVRDLDELHDALLLLGMVPETDAVWPDESPPAEDRMAWFEQLVEADRAFRMRLQDGNLGWVAAERLPELLAIFPDAIFKPQPPPDLKAPSELFQEEAALLLIRGWVECSGPFTFDELARTLTLTLSDMKIAIARLEVEGLVLRGHFRPGATEEEYCDRRILARIHRTTINGLRREVVPVSPAALVRFLFQWQHVSPSHHLRGEGGLLEAIEALQGFEAPAGAWESDLLPARVSGYEPLLLDGLSLAGELLWGRMAPPHTTGNGTSSRVALSRTTPITFALREAVDWLLDQPQTDGHRLSGAAQEVLATLFPAGRLLHIGHSGVDSPPTIGGGGGAVGSLPSRAG